MKKRTTIALIALCCMMLTMTGCSWFRKGKKPGTGGAGTSLLDPEQEFELPERFELGERLPESEVNLEHVLFMYDSDQLSSSELRKIEAAADFMRQNRRTYLVTEGNCDERGSRDYNMALGENRALTVRAYLIRLGISESRIQTKSYGEENPLDPGHAESAWRKNRRVEFAFYRFDR